jgi:NNP family nitrate/nitrite transporter-like MFS transporter
MSRWIVGWDPEDAALWESSGKRIAWRNLVWSVVAENIGFSVWLVWSVVAARLSRAGFHYTTEQLFVLVALPGLVGAIMRFPYTFAVPLFGGRNWTVASALLLLIPTVSLAVLVGRPGTPFWLMASAAATAGLGGGNFASSMANISFFFPDREKGLALGLNAAGGNIGVSNVQFLVPLVVGSGAGLALAGWMWLPFIGLAAIGAYAKMNNLASARSSFGDQLAITRKKHTWVVSWLYVGTFGSFVGYAATFPLLLQTQFPEVTASLAFLGPLVGAVARPFGGSLADRLGGARVTFWNFVAMTIAALGVVHALAAHSFPEFLATFLTLFVTTGIGNGSTFRMVPAIFRAEALAGGVSGKEATTGEDRAAALDRGRRDTAAVLGFSSAIGALGGYLIPQAFSASIRAGGGARLALAMFIAFYATCLAMTWWHYLRGSRVPAEAKGFAEVKV